MTPMAAKTPASPVLDISALRVLEPRIICLGSHRPIVQSILDFDYLAGRPRPSIIAIIATGRRAERYHFGPREVAIPVCAKLTDLPEATRDTTNLILSLVSGRRVLPAIISAAATLPRLVGGTIFAEGVPERHTLQLATLTAQHHIWLTGGASVGLILPAHLKLGAIGGTQATQFQDSRLLHPGHVAVISSSGGMVNEIIRTVASFGHALSFSVALGGERFPLTTPESAFLTAQADPATRVIAYFGELGGTDEYLIADLLTSGRLTKPVVAYIAGAVSDLFATPPQFGHAKAMATNADESAVAKTAALRDAGAKVAHDYAEFERLIRDLPGSRIAPGPLEASGPETTRIGDKVVAANRALAPIATTISRDRPDGEVEVLGQDLLTLAENHSFAHIATSMFLGHQLKSPKTAEFVDFVLRLLVDHGPYVSGAANTIITARAGRDLESSLAAGLLAIGPRFGGATGLAAGIWLTGANSSQTPAQTVENFAAEHRYISGIGHRKYRADRPDPRVGRLLEFAKPLKHKRYTTFAFAVQAITTSKKANLILNVDGAIAAVLLDLLAEQENYSVPQLQALVDTDFFDALFVLSRSVGFMAHYFDQRRLDEGLFRLRPSDVAYIPPSEH